MVAIELAERASWYLGRFAALAFGALVIAGCASTGIENCIAIGVAGVIAGAAGGYKPGSMRGENDQILPTKRDFINHVKLSNVDQSTWPKVQTSAGYHYAYAVQLNNQTEPFQLPTKTNEVKEALAFNGKTVKYTKLEHGYHAETSLGESPNSHMSKRDSYNSIGYYFGEDDPNDGNPSSDTIKALSNDAATDFVNKGAIQACVTFSGPSTAPYTAGTMTLQHAGDPPARNSQCGT
ncbi:uncharacterized protein FA14DRAFT_151947 [Meira miltonrushii]|uniref:Uncharacterized protein n=1 Tax=Meira miltonrushii TaxID=1280837 RepID=A0A316VFU7_9BASI|nr:uncharacterized protein FA14DRAFT_151947 [Meira miltonrushii]PWN36507.1 hypothetical protein FA14DRAFT_151947 [Meira miltonrushii]